MSVTKIVQGDKVELEHSTIVLGGKQAEVYRIVEESGIDDCPIPDVPEVNRLTSFSGGAK